MQTEPETILIVDDAPDLLRGLKRLIEPVIGCRVLLAESAQQAIDVLSSNRVDVVLTDIRMPGMSGMELLDRVRSRHPHTNVILMTAYGSIDQAVEALKRGAYDFVTKPLDEYRLFHTLHNCMEHRRLLRKTELLEEKLKEKEQLSSFVGESPAMQKVLHTIRMVAGTDLTVLITGESGTGKELAARTIHELSGRARKKMVAVNCPAIPETLLESELFGHRKGAFTHAVHDKKGLVEMAHGSTLLLDEIGDLPAMLQTKLLRLLQEGEIKPLGDTRTRSVDIRVISSTNRDLQEKVLRGGFREDLYYRLNVVTILMPPLRELREDIPLMAVHFLNLYAAEAGLQAKVFAPEAIAALMADPWKGNVRQLQNTVKRAAVLSPGNIIQVEHLGLGGAATPPPCRPIAKLCDTSYRSAREQVLKNFTVEYLTELLTRTRGNVSSAALQCGLERQSLQHLMRKYNIRSDEFRKES